MNVYINDIYTHVMKSKARVVVLYGGADSGKSYFVGAQYVPLAMMDKPYFRGLLVRKVASTLKDSVMQEVKDGIDQLGMGEDFRVNESAREITHKQGNKVLCRGLDSVVKLKSIKGLNFIWVEEAEEITEREFDNLLLRLRGGGYERIFLTFNPTDKEHFSYHRFRKVQREVLEVDDEGEPKVWSFETSDTIDGETVSYETLVIKSTYRDNGFISKERKLAIESLKVTNPELYQMLGRGEYVNLGERIFDNWEIVELSAEEERGLSNIRYGIDWGYYPDPFRFLKVDVDQRRKVITIVAEVNLLEKTNAEAVKYIKPLLHHGYRPIVADSAEVKSIKDMRNHGLRVVGAKKGPGSVEYGIKKLHEYKIRINSTCVHSIRDMRNYKRKRDHEGNILATPMDANNHTPDVLRYVMEEYNDSAFVNVRM